MMMMTAGYKQNLKQKNDIIFFFINLKYKKKTEWISTNLKE